MNWTKLKSSIIVVITLLFVNCPADTKGRQFFRLVNKTADMRTQETTEYQTIYKNVSLQTDHDKRYAETIISQVINHLPEHDPLSFESYSAITHHRFHISILLSSNKGELKRDDAKGEINQNNDLFSNETLIVLKRLKPGFLHSENLSGKSEGKDNGTFLALSAHLRDISLFDPVINLFNKNYFSPFSRAAIQNYHFSSRDSIPSPGDTLSIISFHPKEDKQFPGFNGTVVIETKNLSIQKISAHSAQTEPTEPIFVFNQNFEQLKGIWLPSEKNIKVFLHGKNLEITQRSPEEEDNLMVESTTNIYQQQINPPLTPDDFKTTTPVVQNKPAISPTGNYFYIPINQNDSLLKMKVDSAVIAENKIQQTKLIRFITEGKIPLRYFNIDYNRIVGYNIFEGLKLGIGGETNRLLSKYFTVGGYISYGLKDRSVRNGEWINYYPSRSSDLRIQLAYKDVNMELGEPEFLETKTLLNPESYRYLLIKNMYATKRYSAGIEYRPFKEFNYYLFGDISDNHSPQNTSFLTEHPFSPIRLTRIGLQLRYTPGIILQTEDGRQKEMNIPISDYYLTIIQGLTILGGEYHYTKIEFKGKFNLPFSQIGTTTIVLRGGTMSQTAPIIELSNGYGSFAGAFSLAAPYSFATMQLNEFSAANYSALHLRHDFSPWLFSGKVKTSPALVFAQNIGFGHLNDQDKLQFNLNDYRKGFFESGLEVNNILRMNFLSWGVGIYYRYGPYQFSSLHENFAYKFGFFFKL